MRPKEIGLVGFDQVVASHLSGTADAFAAAMLEDGFGGHIPCYRVRTLGLTTEAFRTESGAFFKPDASLDSASLLDTIIVAGGKGLRRPEIRDLLAEWILSRSSETRRIGTIGTGIQALAPTGLLDGREVTTHWRLARALGQSYPRLRIDCKRRLVKDGPFYTAAGLTAGVDLALALIEEDYGKQVALAVGRELMLYLPPASQLAEPACAPTYESRPIDRFGELVAWIMKNLQQDLTVEVMARQACLSPAHFTRAFKSVFGTTPGEFVENLRLNETRRRLASRQKAVRNVALSVGFSSPGAFRRAFERRFGAEPANCLGSLIPFNSQSPVPTINAE